MGQRGRPKLKACAYEGCRHSAGPGLRWCGIHGGKVLAALRESKEYWTHDRRYRHGEGGIQAAID